MVDVKAMMEKFKLAYKERGKYADVIILEVRERCYDALLVHFNSYEVTLDHNPSREEVDWEKYLGFLSKAQKFLQKRKWYKVTYVGGLDTYAEVWLKYGNVT